MEITDEEMAVIEAAEALWEGRCSGTGTKEWNMMKALHALSHSRKTAPYVPLLTDEELWDEWSAEGRNATAALRAVEVLTIRKLAEDAKDGITWSWAALAILADKEEKL